MDDALCWIWRRSLRDQNTLTVEDRSYTNFRELRLGEVRRIPLLRTFVHKVRLPLTNQHILVDTPIK
jgi:hypothetical protein